MPKSDRTPDPLPSKEQVLAAIERAERHRRKLDDPVVYRGKPDQPGVLFATVKEHLGLARGGWTTIQLRPTWKALEAAGLIEQFRASSLTLWRLTTAGQKHLDAARKAGKVGALPESPQHRHWRQARQIATVHISEFREHLRRLLADATGLLDAHDPANSDTWHALGRRLEFACEALASASYCLYEWPEPDDSRADLTPHGKGDRRTPQHYVKA
jgi:hypothetical protein